MTQNNEIEPFRITPYERQRMESRKPITATEIRRLEKEYFEKWNEIEMRLLEPIINQTLTLLKENKHD